VWWAFNAFQDAASRRDLRFRIICGLTRIVSVSISFPTNIMVSFVLFSTSDTSRFSTQTIAVPFEVSVTVCKNPKPTDQHLWSLPPLSSLSKPLSAPDSRIVEVEVEVPPFLCFLGR
jgi:hypothetical protein